MELYGILLGYMKIPQKMSTKLRICQMSVSKSLHAHFLQPFVQDHCVRNACARSIYKILQECLPRPPQQDPVKGVCDDLLCKMFVPRFLKPDPVGALVQKSLHEDPLCKISVSKSSRQDPLGTLAYDLCMRISVRCRCQDPYSRILLERLYKISVWGCP